MDASAVQLDLFGELAAAAPTAPSSINQPRRRPPRRAMRWEQIDILSPAWVNRAQGEAIDLDPFCAAPVIHRVVHAAQARPPRTSGVRSVFDMATSVISKPPRASQTSPEPEPQRYGRTLREGGVTRHIAMRYDETAEWAEKERARRARQKVPRPTQAARTRSRKLLELVGAADGA